jgi:hypothetical protein
VSEKVSVTIEIDALETNPIITSPFEFKAKQIGFVSLVAKNKRWKERERVRWS